MVLPTVDWTISSTQNQPSIGTQPCAANQASAAGEQMQLHLVDPEDGLTLKPLPPTCNEVTLNEALQAERLAWSMQTAENPVSSNRQSDFCAVSEAHPTSRCNDTLALRMGLLRGAKRSRFLEGSMGQMSKGVASTWRDSKSSCSSLLSLSDNSDDLSTSQHSISSRLSTEDFEFKPLPPTPKSIKATVKRLGSKIRMSENRLPTASTIAAHGQRNKTAGKGLRKSISSWRLFDNTVASNDESLFMSDEKDSSESIETNKSIKAFRAFLRKKSPQKPQTAIQVLADRKRKAEATYAEQFGGGKKARSESSSYAGACENDTLTDRSRIYDDTTIKAIRDPCASYQITTHATAKRILAVGQLPVIHPSQPLDPSTFFEAAVQDDASNQALGSSEKLDHSKRASRSELEKENQQLRALLLDSHKRNSVHSKSGNQCLNSSRSSTHSRRQRNSRLREMSGPSQQFYRDIPESQTLKPAHQSMLASGNTATTPEVPAPVRPKLSLKCSGAALAKDHSSVLTPLSENATSQRSRDGGAKSQERPYSIFGANLGHLLLSIHEPTETREHGEIECESAAKLMQASRSDRDRRCSYDGTSENHDRTEYHMSLEKTTSVSKEAVFQWPDDVF